MAVEYTKVYISMPRIFLTQLDELARKEHQSRSAIIRESVKLYMEWRTTSSEARFFSLSKKLAKRFTHIPEEELESRIDSAVDQARHHGR